MLLEILLKQLETMRSTAAQRLKHYISVEHLQQVENVHTMTAHQLMKHSITIQFKNGGILHLVKVVQLTKVQFLQSIHLIQIMNGWLKLK